MIYPIRLLIVEDYQDTAQTLKGLFEAEGLECDVARTVKTATEIFNIRCDSGLPCYDGALVDMNLPDAFGTVLLKAIRTVHETLPLFTVTAYVDDFVRARCKTAGSPIVLKPAFTFEGAFPTLDDVGIFKRRVVETATAYHDSKVVSNHPRLILPEIIERLINEPAA